MKKTSLNLAVVLILSATSQLSFASDADLQKQLSSLKQQIETLQQRLNAVEAQPQTKAAVVAPVNDSIESYSSEDIEASELATGPTPATSDDVEGLRADVENYKYDQSRQYERQTVKSARDTTLFGTVQLRANVQDNNTAPNTPKSTFDIGTALLGVRGNLFKDYNEGKNLDYQASFGYSKRNDGRANSNMRCDSFKSLMIINKLSKFL